MTSDIGMAVSVITDAAMIMTGSFSARLLRGGFPYVSGELSDVSGERVLFLVSFIVLTADLLLAAALLWYRPHAPGPPGVPVPPASTSAETHLPDYDSTHLDAGEEE